MDAMKINRLFRMTQELGAATNPDLTIRQLSILLQVAAAGHAGVDVSTLELKTKSSQAAVSRTLKMLGVTYGLIVFHLDQADGRRRIATVTPTGAALLAKISRTLE